MESIMEIANVISACTPMFLAILTTTVIAGLITVSPLIIIKMILK